MASTIAAITALFSRKKRVKSAACMISLDHTHTDACFIDVMPLSIVELFQSQGCKSCPPAIPQIHKAAASNPNLLLLTYDVTYFDSQGWKDTFASPQWDARQRAYATKWERKGIFTPQVVVDGVINDAVGADDKALGDIMMQTMDAKKHMTWNIMIEQAMSKEIKITSDRAEAEVHDVLIVEYDPAMQQVKIGGGANKKVKLMHLNVVKGLMKIGEWRGGHTTVALPPPSKSGGLERVVFVQDGPGGPIVAAMKL